MNLIDANYNRITIPYDSYVLVALDSLFMAKTMASHDALLRWQDSFWQIQMPIVLVSTDPNYRVSRSYIHYLYCIDRSFYKEYHRYQTKMVFGKKVEILQPGLFVVARGKVIKTMNRVNEKSIAEVYLFVLKRWVKDQQKKVKKIIDNGKCL